MKINNIQDYIKKVDEVIANGKYKNNWESLAEYPIPEWYKNSKLGIFLHWGVYSVPAFENEWYPRYMYYSGTKTNIHHIEKYGQDFHYSQFIDMFKAENFNADNMVKAFKEAGFKFIMQVGEHHDGFKMYDSNLSSFNSVEKGPKRDILKEYKLACEKQGIEFATSSHRAEHFWYFNGARNFSNDFEPLKPEMKDLYGDCMNVYTGVIGSKGERKREKGIKPTVEWLENWLAHSAELIDNYQPSALFFDWWICEKEFRPYVKKFLAYYYNRSIEWEKQVALMYKYDAVMYNSAIYDKERGGISTIKPTTWQCETSTAKTSWGYTTNQQWKSSFDIICMLVDVISKNGNFVLNFGPKADGSLADEELKILKDIGCWTKKNEKAIWGITPYKIYGEGKKRKEGSFKENIVYNYCDYRFTYRPCHIYVFALKVNPRGIYKIKTLKNDMENFNCTIKNIKILGCNCNIEWIQNKRYLLLKTEYNSNMPLCFDVEID